MNQSVVFTATNEEHAPWAHRKVKPMVENKRMCRGTLVLFSVVLALASPLLHAQGSPWFQVSVAGESEEQVPLASLQELAIDDIVFDYKEVSSPPADAPASLAEAQAQGYRLFSPGSPHYGNATLTLAPGQDTDWLYQWWAEAAKGKNIRKSISVILYRTDKTPGRGYTLFDCFPSQWDAAAPGSGAPAPTETLRVNIGRIELMTFTAPQSGQGGVSVTVDDGSGQALTDTWESWGGGQPETEIGQQVENAPYRTNSPGHKSVGELRLIATIWGSKKGYDYWMNRALAGAPWLAGPNGVAAGKVFVRCSPIKKGSLASALSRTYIYSDCFPVRYTFPRMSVTNTTGNVREEVRIKPIRFEMQ